MGGALVYLRAGHLVQVLGLQGLREEQDGLQPVDGLLHALRRPAGR